MRKRKYWRSKRSLSLALAGILTVFSIPGVTAQAAGAQPVSYSGTGGTQLYVSADGSEGADGTMGNPYPSLEAARDAIREMKKAGLPDGGVTVNIRGGEYALLEDSFRLEAQDSGTADSPIVWKAYEGETVQFVGNIVVDGGKFKQVTDQAILDRLPDEAEDEILVYDLAAENGLTSFSGIPKNGYGWPSQASAMSVLVDGEAQVLSRYPNNGFLTISSIQSSGFIPRDHLANPDGTCPECTKDVGGSVRIPCKYGESEFLSQPGGVFTTNNAEVVKKYSLWEQETDIWTAGYFCWDWADDSCAISKVEQTDAGVRLTMSHPSRYGVKGSGRRFYAYNLLCEIDEPGEWYLDRENAKLYLYPTKDITGSGIELSMQTKPLVTMEDTSYVSWQGVTFTKSNGHGISMLDCDHVEIAGCDFSDLGQRAVCIGDPNETDINTGARGGSDNVVRSCDITRTGQGGIFVGGGNRYTLTAGNNKVVNCDISDYATIKRTYSPAVELVGCGNSAERNEIYDAPHLAIQFKGNDMLIYGNDIHDVCYETADCGAIYSVRRWSWQGNVVKNNFIHDLVNTGGIGSAAVYVDDLGSGVTMTENLLVNIPGYTTLFGGGRDNVITNNIQINNGNGKGFDYDNRGLGWAWYHAAGPDGECYGELVALRANAAYNKELWDEKYPGLAEIDLDTVTTRTDKGDGFENYYSEAAKPANAVIENNILVGVANPFGNVSGDVKTNGTFQNNETYDKGTDIGFSGADVYDFTVLEDSTIKDMLGDAHFHVEEMGLYEDAYRTLEKTVLAAPELIAPQDGETGLIVTNGVRFSWNTVAGAGTYKLEIAKDQEFSDVAVSMYTDAGTVSVTGLEKEAVYYWRVTARERAVNGAESVSSVRSFTTSALDDASFFEGFRNFDEWEPLVENGVQKGTPGNTTANSHSGRYSYELDEGMDVVQKIFGTRHNDVASVWLYDNMNKGRGAAAIVNVTREENGSTPWIGAGVSVSTGGAYQDHYVVRIGGSWYETEIERTEGWHELKWDYTDEGTCIIYIDGEKVYTLESAPYYDRILMGDFWNHAGYAGDVSGMLFDDVTVDKPVVKENILEIAVPETEITLNLDETYRLEPVVETDPDVDAEITFSAQEWEIASVDKEGVITPVRPGSTIVTISSKNNPAIRTEVKVEVLNQINLAGLQELYDALLKYTKADYAPESWTALADALVQAYEVLQRDVITVDMRDKAVQALETGREGLVDVRANLVGENSGFEQGNTDGFAYYPTNGDGQVKVEAVTDAAYAGEHSVLVETHVQVPYDEATGKGYPMMGLMYVIPGDELQAGAQYDISFRAKSADGITRDMGTKAVFRTADGSGASGWTSVGEEWTMITYRTNVIPEGLSSLDIIMGNRNNDGHAGQYYIDDVKISVVTPVVKVEGISLDQTDLIMSKDSNVTLNASVVPEGVTNDTIAWSTSDSSVAVVENGVVRIAGYGSAKITATTLDGGYRAECTITVPVPVSGVLIGCSTMSVTAGSTFALQAAVLPVDASNKNVSWSSSDEAVATVDENGNVTAVSAGEAVITVTTEEGGFADTCSVTVKAAGDVSGGDVSGGDVSGGDVPGSDAESISLDTTEKALKPGESFELKATILPEDADTSVTWFSSDTNVAVVKDGMVTAVGVGEAVIVVTTVKGGLAATCKVTVEEEKVPVDPEDPTKPSDPEDPTKPSEPEDPTKPTEPEEPTKPTEPEDPTKPTEPEDPAKPAEPANPSDSGNTDSSSGRNTGSEEEQVEVPLIYKVVSGDTLNRIAARYGLTLRQLLAMNPGIKNPNRIYPGQQIVVGTTKVRKGSAESEMPGDAEYYVVQKGDCLSRIAYKLRIKLADLRAMNRKIFAQKYIYPGQRLRIK